MRTILAAIGLSFRAISRAKLRSALTILGILIGVAAVVIVVALGNAIREQVMAQIATLGANTIYIFPQESKSTGRTNLARARLSEADGIALLRESQSLSALTPQSSSRATVVFGDRNHPTQIFGVGESYLQVMAFSIDEGTAFLASDFRTKSKVVLLGSTVKRELFGTENAIGEYVRIGKHPFKVVGILTAKGQSPFGEDQDDRMLTPVGTFRSRLSPSAPGRVQMLIAQARDEESVVRATRQIEQVLRQRHKIDPEDEPDFGVRTQSEIRKSNEETFNALTTILSLVAAISLLVGGIGVMNVMLVSVTERTREIGIRMAIGASGSDILLQFLVEAVVLSMLGGLLGIALGLGVNWGVARSMGWEVGIPGSAIAIAVGVSASVGIFFGFVPARRAARMDPIDALRHE